MTSLINFFNNLPLIRWIRLNYWRFPTNWDELTNWYYSIKGDLLWRWEMWCMWYSPPWSKTRRCPICAGSGRHPKYGDKCDDCEGTGKMPKYF